MGRVAGVPGGQERQEQHSDGSMQAEVEPGAHTSAREQLAGLS